MKEKILKDCKNLMYAYLTALTSVKILFINESILNTFLVVSVFFWLFVLPGFFMTQFFGISDFLEKFIIGVLLSGALVGISAYYLSILGIHVKYSAIILPPLFIAVSLLLIDSKNRFAKNKETDAIENNTKS